MSLFGHDWDIPVPSSSGGLVLLRVLLLLLLVVDPRHCCGRDAVVTLSTGEFNGACAEGSGDVFEENLHGRDVCCSASLGVREDMATHPAAGGFKDPCSGIAGHYKHTTSATNRSTREIDGW